MAGALGLSAGVLEVGDPDDLADDGRRHRLAREMSLDLHVPREWFEARSRAERGEVDDMTDANGDGCVDQRDLILHLSSRSLKGADGGQ